MKLMKQTLRVLVLTMTLIISGLVLVPSTAKANECEWTLYVNGSAYSTDESYYTSGQLVKNGSTVTLKNFTGQTIEAVPEYSDYGDEDAPQLTISVVGNCTLTGGELNDGSYGTIYVEPHTSGNGAASKVTIQGSGTLNLTYKDKVSDRAENEDYNLICADWVYLSGETVCNLTAEIYGQYPSTTLYGVNAYKTYFTQRSQVNIILKCGTCVAASGSKNKPQGYVVGVYNTLIHNSTRYASIDTGASENSGGVQCTQYVYANSASGLYLTNVSGSETYTELNNTDKMEYTASDYNRSYTAVVPIAVNSDLKQIAVSDIVSEAKFAGNGAPMKSDTAFTSNEAKGYYVKTTMFRRDVSSGQVWKNQDMFYASPSLEYAYEEDIQTVPMPGYQIVSAAMASNGIKAAAGTVLGYTPERANYNSTSATTSLTYSYVIPTITKQPASVYDIDNPSDISITCEVPTETCTWENTFDMGAEMRYEWFLRVYSDASTYQDIPMDTFGGDMDGFDHLDTSSPDLGFDATYRNFEVQVKGKTIKLGNAAKLEIFCKVSTIADYVCTEKSQLLLGHDTPAKVALAMKKYTYDGKVKTPAIKAYNANQKLISAENYDVKYSSGRKNVGTYTATVTFKGIYSGEETLSFTIVPKATSIKKITALRKGFNITWKKQSTQVTGYEIRYSLKANMAKAKTVKVTKYKTTKKTISKLNRKKKYYVQIRTYKTVKGTPYYSEWSKKKTVKTK